MKLIPIERVSGISPGEFQEKYLKTKTGARAPFWKKHWPI